MLTPADCGGRQMSERSTVRAGGVRSDGELWDDHTRPSDRDADAECADLDAWSRALAPTWG